MDTLRRRSLFQRFRDMRFMPQTSPDEPQETEESPGYEPSPVDIVVVHVMLARLLKLPPDIVQGILDHAEYWAHSSNEIDFQEEQRAPLRVSGRTRQETKLVLRSYPVGLLGVDSGKTLAETLAYDTRPIEAKPLQREHDQEYFTRFAKYPMPPIVSPVRKVVFSIRSHDQGTGGEPRHRGTYTGSWTFFQAGLERFDAEQTCEPHCVPDVRYEKPNSSSSPTFPICSLRTLQPPSSPSSPSNPERQTYEIPLAGDPAYVVQYNKTATRHWQDHKVTWSYLDDVPADSPATDELKDLGRGRATGDGRFVRELKVGDVVTLWAIARFGAWHNIVGKAKIDIYWAI